MLNIVQKSNRNLYMDIPSVRVGSDVLIMNILAAIFFHSFVASFVWNHQWNFNIECNLSAVLIVFLECTSLVVSILPLQKFKYHDSWRRRRSKRIWRHWEYITPRNMKWFGSRCRIANEQRDTVIHTHTLTHKTQINTMTMKRRWYYWRQWWYGWWQQKKKKKTTSTTTTMMANVEEEEPFLLYSRCMVCIHNDTHKCCWGAKLNESMVDKVERRAE